MPQLTDYRVIDFAFSTSYPTGGESFDPKDLNPLSGYAVLPQAKAGYVFAYDPATKKILAYRQTAATGALAEVANGVNISAANPVPVLILPKT